MKILDFFLLFWVIQQLKLMRIHADPDTDPKPWLPAPETEISAD
jgi:hypothetical protein